MDPLAAGPELNECEYQNNDEQENRGRSSKRCLLHDVVIDIEDDRVHILLTGLSLTIFTKDSNDTVVFFKCPNK